MMNTKLRLLLKLILAYLFLVLIGATIYYCIYLNSLEATLSDTAIGLLGWTATLYTPIAAYILIDSWKNQVKYSAILDQIIILIEELSKLSTHIDIVRKNEDIYLYLYSMYLSFEDFNAKDFKFIVPSFDDIYHTLERIRISNLKIYILDENMKSHIFEKPQGELDDFRKLERMIKGLESSFYAVKHHNTPIDKGVNIKDAEIFLQKCLYINGNFADEYRSSMNPSVKNIHVNQLNEILEQSFENLKKFRKKLK